MKGVFLLGYEMIFCENSDIKIFVIICYFIVLWIIIFISLVL